jgi:PilZ domain
MNVPDEQLANTAVEEDDNREHTRYSVQVEIEIHAQGVDVPVRLATTDLARGGCYVQMSTQLGVGTPVRATLWLDDCPVFVRGLVVTRHPQFGNGIRFMEFEGEGEGLLARYLNAITA